MLCNSHIGGLSFLPKVLTFQFTWEICQKIIIWLDININLRFQFTRIQKKKNLRKEKVPERGKLCQKKWILIHGNQSHFKEDLIARGKKDSADCDAENFQTFFSDGSASNRHSVLMHKTLGWTAWCDDSLPFRFQSSNRMIHCASLSNRKAQECIMAFACSTFEWTELYPCSAWRMKWPRMLSDKPS